MNDQHDLAMMSTDELWALYEKIRAILPTKLEAEKHRLDVEPQQVVLGQTESADWCF
jgi:hypothetical protein